MTTNKAVPFSVNRNDTRPLVDQVADGLRESIVGGFYRQGDKVPSYCTLADALGVSRIVTKAALRRIAEEGLVVSRPGSGSTVCDRNVCHWKGRVLMVVPDGDDNYMQTILAGSLRDRLAAAGWLFSQVCVRKTPGGCYDFSNLEAELSRSVNLVVAVYVRQSIFTWLARRRTPFAVFAEVTRRPIGAMGFTTLDYNGAVRDFAAECRRIGVTEVVEFFWDRMMCDITSEFAAAGIRVRKVRIGVKRSLGRIADVQRAGMDMFLRLAADKHANRKAAYFFADDHLASGALVALSYAGIKAPDDVRIATWSNRGLGPVYPRKLSRMEIDPEQAGKAVADAVLTYLSSGVYPSGGVVSPVWISGETLGKPHPSRPSSKERTHK